MQKYRQIKNQALTNFIKNNQWYVIKKESKTFGRDIDKMNGIKKIGTKKRII